MIPTKIRLAFAWILHKPLSLLIWFVSSHIKACLYAFDPIIDAPPGVVLHNLASYRVKRARELRIQRFFILPICVWAFFAAHTVWVMWKNDFEYYTRPMAELLTHRMYPEEFWRQGDMAVLAGIIGIGLYGFTFAFGSWLSDRYCMYFVYDPSGEYDLIINGKVWENENVKKMYKFRNLTKKAILPVSSSAWLICYLFFLWNFARADFDDIGHRLLLVFYLPILVWYCVLTAIMMFYHFFVITKYVMIKQAYLIGQQDELIKRLNGNTKPSKLRLYFEFRAINTHLAYQCAEIRGYNCFWASAISIIFGVDIVIVCYLLYSFIFYEQTSVIQFVYFFFFIIEIGSFIFIAISLACMVDRNNDLCYERNMKAGMAFGLNFDNRSSIRQLIHINKIATNRNFSKCCFRLVNGYRLDSTAFNMAIFIMSTFFLYICRQNHKHF